MLSSQQTVYVRSTRAAVLRVVRRLPAIAAGASGARTASRVLMVRIGLAALAKIRRAFLVKAYGGTDDAGLRWRPLKPSTIAYSRKHPGVPSPKVRARYAPSWMLTKAQRARWWSLYKGYLSAFKGDKGHAAGASWRVLKDEGAKTLLGVYGNTPVLIMIDTGALFSSLSPGTDPDRAWNNPPRVPRQVFRIGRGEVVVGTRRPFAACHHRGIPGKLPQRRLWPEPARWPSSWWRGIQTQALHGIIDIALFLLGRF